MMSERFKGEQGDTLTVSEWIVHPVDGSQPILTEWELHRTPETGFEHHTRRRAQTVATVSGRLVLGRGDYPRRGTSSLSLLPTTAISLIIYW
jgi:hypothetical protein